MRFVAINKPVKVNYLVKLMILLNGELSQEVIIILILVLNKRRIDVDLYEVDSIDYDDRMSITLLLLS